MLGYLKKAPVVLAASAGFSKCLLCKTELPAAEYQSDDQFLWPSSLYHYMAVHSVRLPDNFAVHMKKKGFKPPSESVRPIEKLPWPEDIA